jgi:hypothetical protein
MAAFQSLPLQGLYLTIADKNIHLLHHQEKSEQGRAHVFVLEGTVTLFLEASEGDHLTVPYSQSHGCRSFRTRVTQLFQSCLTHFCFRLGRCL